MMALPVLARELHHVVYLGKKCAMLDHLLLVVTGESPVLLLVDVKRVLSCHWWITKRLKNAKLLHISY